jgi:hypothetical protein
MEAMSSSDLSGESLKNKFKGLKNKQKPTGNPYCPREVLQAKSIQVAIEKRMSVSDFDDSALSCFSERKSKSEQQQQFPFNYNNSKCNKFHLENFLRPDLTVASDFAPGSNRGLELLNVKFRSGIITILDLHSELMQDKEPLAGTLK